MSSQPLEAKFNFSTASKDGQSSLKDHSADSSTVHSPVQSLVELEKSGGIKETTDIVLDDEPVEEALPEKVHGRLIRQLRYHLLNIYRRIFGVIFIVNMAIFIATLAKGHHNASYLGLVVIANIFVSVVIRQEHIVNILFYIFCSVPPSWPLIIRTTAARIYSLGGVHSGSSVSGTIWFILFTGQATAEVVSGGKTTIPTLVIAYLILVLLLAIIALAHPKFRQMKHDSFERTHRFFGWTTVGLVWALVVLLVNDYREPGQKLGSALTKSIPFWLVAILTASIIYPWLHLRKRTVRSEVLSPHCVRLFFNYGATPVPGSFVRFSTSPLLEWHSFATISEPNKPGQYSIIISRAGDWTSHIIENPPSSLWVRGLPTCGVMRIAPMFRRLVLVATGSGIAPIAPHVLAKRFETRLVWVSPNIRETFGSALVDEILKAEPNAVIHDTKVHGRPDMVKMSYQLYREFDAEAVCIISNQKLTQKVVYGLMSRGVPAFGAIWDS